MSSGEIVHLSDAESTGEEPGETTANEDLKRQLVAVTGESRVSKKQRVLNEPVVDQDDIDDLEALTRGDPRGALGVKDGFAVEIKWKIEYEEPTPHHVFKWYPATVLKAETGETHRFRDEVNTSEYVDSPVVTIRCDDDEEEGEYVFISPHEIYSREYDCILLWRKKGDPWDMEVDESEEDPNGESIDLTDGNVGEQVDRIVSSMMVDILSKYKDRFDQFSQVTQVNFGRETLKFKKVLSGKITEWFERKQKAFDDGESQMLTTANIVLKSSDIEDIVQEVFVEMNE